jgi:DNA-binding transcriptional LysR family regulator
MRLLVSRHLENFLALYDARKMHAAAERKGISQPALTKSLRLLEEDLGAELFVRTHKGLEPTEAGDVLYRHARAIDQEARFASMEVREVQRNLGGRLRIGVGPVLAISTFPAALVDFHRQFPSLEVVVETGMISTQLIDSLIHDNLDMVIAASIEQPLPERYGSFLLFKSQMIALCRAGHPLHSSAKVGLDELAAFGRVGFIEDREFEKKSRRAFGSRADRLRPVLQTGSLSVMFGILAATDYFAIVSEMVLPRAQREGLARLPVEHELWHIDIELMCKISLFESRPVTAIRRALLARA